MGRKRTSKPNTAKKRSQSTTSRSRAKLALAAVAVVVGALIVAAAVLLRSHGRQSVATGAFRGWNLLFVTIDTLRPDRLGSYGSTAGLTPYLDRLASEGVRFERVLAHVPLTLPAHSSIFTSLYPTEHGVHDNGTFRLSEAHPTLATLLRSAGYRTGAFVGAFVLDARFGLNQGFDVYDDRYEETRAFLSFAQIERPADAVVSAAERWIGETEGRWFAWLHLFDPHAPYRPPPELARRFPSDLYGGEVAFVDAAIGGLLERLTASGRLERTLVVVLGDHGESLGEHGERTHGTFAYDSTLRVPWILWSREFRPQVFTQTVRQVDVMPTLLDLLGVAAPSPIAGQSLRPYLTGERRYEAPPSYFEALNTNLTRDWAPLTGVVEDGHKLVRLPIAELYDLTSDPGETDNVYRQKTGLASRLETTLDAISAGAAPTAEAAAVPDEETLAKLRALGYVTAPVATRKGDYGEADDPKRLIAVANAYDEATELFGEGRTEEAIAIFEDVLEKDPRSSEAHRNLAYALHQTGRLDEAIALLESAVESGLSDVSTLAMLGAYLLDAGQPGKAAALLEALVDEAPEYAEGHNSLAIAYGRLGRYDDARRELERVLALDPSSATSYNNLGSLALSQGRLDEAIDALEKALVLDPGHAAALNGLGFARARRGELDEAIELWRRAVERDPGQFDALFNLAMALSDRSPPEAVPYLERFVREAPPRRYGADIEKARALLATIASRK